MKDGDEMKKFGIVTTIYGNNFGESLQGFAMRRAVNIYVDGIQAEMVNYIWHPQSTLVKPGFEHYQKQLMAKNELFDEFRRTELGLTEPPVDKLTEDNEPGFDGYIFGSDQIWNTNAWKIPEFFGSFVPKTKPKIAYAASIGLKADSPLLDRTLFEEYIDTFSSLSVREFEHCDFVRQFTSKNVSFVADPTLLLNNQIYRELMPKTVPNRPDHNYIFYYQPHSADGAIVSLINRLSRKDRLDVVHTFADIPKPVFAHDSISARFSGPREFLYYINNASIIITRSYHAAVFSILFHKPFYVYVDKKTGSRFESLLKTLGLEDRLVYDELMPEQISYNIDYNSVDEKLCAFRSRSIEYLRDALSRG